MNRAEYLLNITKSDDVNHKCKYCGSQIYRVRFSSGRLEDYSAYMRRKFCSRMCMRKSFVKTKGGSEKWTPPHKSARCVSYLILGKEKVCEICGSTSNIDVHHIDFDKNNNRSNNLICLCRSCHLKIHRGSLKLENQQDT